MTKFFAFASIATFTALAAVAIDWSNDAVINLADGATVVTSSRPGDAANICDGSDGSSWQANPDTHSFTQDWALIDLGEVKEFNAIDIIWESSHPTSYSIYVSETAIPYSAKQGNRGTDENPKWIDYNGIDADWLVSATPVITGGETSETGFTDNLELDADVKGRYILIYCNEYNGWANTYGARIFEARVAKIADKNLVSALKVSDSSVYLDETTTVSVTPVNVLGTELDNNKITDLTLTCDNDEAVEITDNQDGTFTVKGLRTGTYTLTASANADGETVTGTASFAVLLDWSKVNNLATGKKATARLTDDVAEDYGHGAAAAVDGNTDTYYEFDGGWGGGDGWVVVDLGSEYMIDAFGAQFSNGSGNFKFAYATEPAETDFGNVVWKGNTEGWTLADNTPLNRDGENVATFIPNAPVRARYIAVLDNDNPGGKPQLREIYASGEEYTASVATSIEVTADLNYISTDESVNLSAVVYDQYGYEMPEAEVVFSSNDNGDAVIDNTFRSEITGTFEVIAKCGEVTSEPVYITVSAHKSKLLVLQPYVRYGADLDGKHFNEDNEEVSNGTSIRWNTSSTIEVDTDEEIRVIFAKTCDFDLVKLNWEAACPSDYTVEATYGGDGEEMTTATVLTVTGRAAVAGTNPVDRIAGESTTVSDSRKRAIAASSPLKNVAALTIKPTAKMHPGNWGANKLLGMDFYGIETDTPTSVISIYDNNTDVDALVDVYSTTGVLLRRGVERDNALDGLARGIYIVGGKKVVK